MTHIVIQEALDGKACGLDGKGQRPANTASNKRKSMELIFALIARRGGYKQSDSFVPDSADFLPFDLRALDRSYGSETNSITL
jgi:hypothetical protein